eukprot:TRINITY_DN112_c0_g1_i3.p1 TRINITY_DN112_c0_g1~~TRINITY_DN112_c0_g1_i3.p1  ORF type:complete len:579 (-),score=167.07 TRINITY_DN112_c0_g1_i3:27-1763(-)
MESVCDKQTISELTKMQIAPTPESDKMALSFLPELKESPLGWGPPEEQVFFQDVPYAPFTKNERLGKAADWTNSRQQYQPARAQQAVTTQFNQYDEVEDDEDFHLVDSRPAGGQRNRFGANRYRGAARGGRFRNQQQQRRGQQNSRYPQQNQGGRQDQRSGGRGGNIGGRSGQRGGFQQSGGNRRWNYQNDKLKRQEPSIAIATEWGDAIETFEFSSLQKLKNTKYSEPEDILEAGSVEQYNTAAYTALRSERPLEKQWATDRTFYKVTTSDDPNIRKFADDKEADVFMTDTIISYIMACARSNFSWDVVITKRNGQIFFDKRGNRLDLVSVNENNNADQGDLDENSVNSSVKLSQEATVINQNFSQQVLVHSKDKAFSFEEPNPFAAGESNIASVAYRYRRWEFPNFSMLVRCEVDAYRTGKDGNANFALVRALNEYDPKLTGDWRKKLETQRGGVLLSEYKNNAVKLARWTCCAILAGASTLELGFVSRQNPRDALTHTILAVQSTKPSEIQQQMALSLDNMWSIVRLIVETVQKYDDGKFLLFKDVGQPNLKLFSVPYDAFDSDGGSGSGQLILK